MTAHQTEVATVAGGCFWCLDSIFRDLNGVEKVESGYAGGQYPNPSYRDVCSGMTGHAEVVQVTFDPSVISFRDLLGVFFTIHDPTTLDRQGADVGTQYRSAVFKARNHTVICDQPAENGGFDEGMTPPEFMLASLGACAGYYAAQYLKTRRLAVEGLRVRVTAEKGTGPARLVNFRIEVELPALLDERHEEGVLRAVHSCLIHNTLLNTPEIATVVTHPIAA